MARGIHRAPSGGRSKWLTLMLAVGMLMALAVPAGAAAPGPVTVDFESLTGPSVFSTANAPVTLGGMTVSGGQILTAATNMPANRSTVYGTSYFCSGCQQTLLAEFDRPVDGLAFDLLNGTTVEVSYAVNTAYGIQIHTLPSNWDSGMVRVTIPERGVLYVIIAPQYDTSGWDFFVDNFTFYPRGAGHKSSTVPLETAQWVPVRGVHRMSCTWGAALKAHCTYKDYKTYHPYPALDIQTNGTDPDPVYAAGSGTVVATNTVDDNGFGKWVLIYHKDDGPHGRTSLYAHLSEVLVDPNNPNKRTVTKDTVIGYMGDTGDATGVHLHYAEAKGKQLKPFWSTATKPGAMKAIVGGVVVSYPSYWGLSSWTKANFEPEDNPYYLNKER